MMGHEVHVSVPCIHRLRRPHRCLGSFTLIELLVVVAIVSVLAAMLLPALHRAKESGRRAKCMSNLKQFGVALELYASDDSEQRLPDGDWGAANVFNTGRPLVRYGLNNLVATCPSAYPFRGTVAQGSQSYFYPVRTNFNTSNNIAMHYCYVGGHGGHPSNPATGWPYVWTYGAGAQLKIRDLSVSKPLMWDISYTQQGVQPQATSPLSGHYWTYPPRSNHSNEDGTACGENMLFGDGHVEWIPLTRGRGKDPGHFFRDYYIACYK